MVTGASSGIGRAAARTLARQGWNVVLASRSASALAAVQRECSEYGIDTLALPTDVGSEGDVDSLFASAVERFGKVDAVVHAAASVAYGRFQDVPADVFNQVIATNLLGTANVARAALRQFGGQAGGRLVLMGSLLGKIAVPYLSPYVTSKWGVQGLARMIQIEARETPGVEVTIVSPGSVNTPAYSQAGNYTGWEGRPPPPVDPPEKVARAIVRSLSAPRRERSVGIANHVVVLGFRLLPGIFDPAVSPLMKLAGLSRRPVPDHPGSVLEPQPDGEAEHGWWGRFGRRSNSRVAPAAR